MTLPSISTNVTGRDDYLANQAIIYAIAYIQNLPKDQQERSNMMDMCAIARTLPPTALALLVAQTQLHTGTIIDIWPGEDADFDVATRRERKAFKSALNAVIAARANFLDQFAEDHPLDKEVAA